MSPSLRATSLLDCSFPILPRRYEHEIECRGARPDGGEAQSAQPAHKARIHEGEARVDQHSSKRRKRQSEYLRVEGVAPREADDGGVDLRSRNVSSPHVLDMCDTAGSGKQPWTSVEDWVDKDGEC